MNLNSRDAYALMLATGIKIGGGSWSQALLWGMGARLIMKYTGFPEAYPLDTPAANLLQDVGGFVSRVFGQPPPDQVQQNGADQQQQQPQYSQTPQSSGDVIDAEYTDYGYQAQ